MLFFTLEELTTSSLEIFTKDLFKQKVYLQQNILMSAQRNPKAEGELSLTSSHYLTAHSCPFSHAKDPLFHRVLQKVRTTNHKYITPKRHQVTGTLFDAHFACYQKNWMEALLSRIIVDGATIVRTPMMNIMASSPNNPSCVLDVVDQSKQMIQGGKTDVWYIAKNILPIMKRMILTKSE